MTLLREISLIIMVCLLPNFIYSSTDGEISGTISSNSSHRGGNSGSAGTDMSHVFRHGESEEEKRVRAAAEEAQQRIDYYNRIANDPSHTYYPALRDKVNNLNEAVKVLTSLVEKRNKVREKIASMDYRIPRERLVAQATDSLRVSREYYLANEFEEGNIAAAIADNLLNLATSLTPGISWVRDLYEAISGKDLLSGEDLDSCSRTFAVLGSVSFGIGSKITKGFKVISRLMKGEKVGEVVLRAKHIADSASEIRRFGPLEEGVLHAIIEGNGHVSDTFRSGSYFELTLKEPLSLYRVFNDNTKMAGRYWSRIKPTGPLQAQLDSALLPTWGNVASKWVELKIPAGTRIYEGVVSAQYLKSAGSKIEVGQLLGGGNQVYINQRINIEEWKMVIGEF
jgi:hypothetical protein